MGIEFWEQRRVTFGRIPGAPIAIKKVNQKRSWVQGSALHQPNYYSDGMWNTPSVMLRSSNFVVGPLVSGRALDTLGPPVPYFLNRLSSHNKLIKEQVSPEALCSECFPLGFSLPPRLQVLPAHLPTRPQCFRLYYTTILIHCLCPERAGALIVQRHPQPDQSCEDME